MKSTTWDEDLWKPRTSSVTRGFSQGEKLSWRRPTGHWKGPTR